MGYLREAADAGHHAAQYYLAVAYESGTGTEADIPAALELLKRSAHNDYAPALNRLAQLHLTGELPCHLEPCCVYMCIYVASNVAAEITAVHNTGDCRMHIAGTLICLII